MKDTALGEGLVTNVASPHAIFATRLSPRAVYFIQLLKTLLPVCTKYTA